MNYRFLNFLMVLCAPVFLSQVSPIGLDENTDEITLESDPNCTYYLQYSPDLSTWLYTGKILNGDGTTHTEAFTRDTPKKFFRYQEILTSELGNIDTDSDGLSDEFELKQSNDTYSPVLDDSDGNGTSDGLEDLDGDGETKCCRN